MWIRSIRELDSPVKVEKVFSHRCILGFFHSDQIAAIQKSLWFESSISYFGFGFVSQSCHSEYTDGTDAQRIPCSR